MKKKVLILSGTGMLGSMLLDVLSKSTNIDLAVTVRDKKNATQIEAAYPHIVVHIFDAEKQSIIDIPNVEEYAWIINAIGKIKPYIKENNAEDIERAIRVNSLFPHVLAREAKKSNIIQIATDCVFSGKYSGNKEEDLHDPLDVYGKTKSLGEINANNFYNLRCSIIGPELRKKVSLLEWFLSQPKNSQIQGFINHSWNGVTTLQFSKICLAIIENEIKISNIQHIVPADVVSKAELLEYFKKEYGRHDIVIKKTDAKIPVERVLSTSNPVLNRKIWKHAGYKNIPSIKQMISELSQYTFAIK